MTELAFFASSVRVLEVTPSAALKLARGAAKVRQLRFADPHAYVRMQKRGATQQDVARAVMTCTSIAPDRTRESRFRLTGGMDLENQAMTVVIAIDGGIVTVITITS